jgi:outer membrane protein assembly factor BamB
MKRKLILGIVIVMLVLNSALVFGQPAQPAQTNDPQPTATVDWWTQCRHDAANTGSTTGFAPSSFQQKWQTTLMDDVYSTTPVIVNNRVYINTNSYYFLTPPPNRTLTLDAPPCTNLPELMRMPPKSDGSMNCLDTKTGSLLWRTEYTSPNDPAYLNDKLYFTEFTYPSTTSNLYCLNATTGSEVYAKTLNGVGSTPTIIANDKLYFGTINLDSYYSYLYSTTLNGNPVWSYPLPGNQLLLSAPTVDNGNIYVITIDLYNYYTGSLICLNAETGTYQWSKTVGNLFLVLYSPNVPVASQGNVYVTDFNLQSYVSYVRCFDGTTGTQIWARPFNQGFSFCPPSLSNGYVYTTYLNINTYTTDLVKLSATNGTILWTMQTPGGYSLLSSTICTADTVLCSSYNGYGYYDYTGTIAAFDKNTGNYCWSHDCPNGVGSGISVANDTLYFIDNYNTAHAIADQVKITGFKGGILAAKAMLTNEGNQTFTTIQTRIIASGGALNNIHISKDNTIDSIKPGQTIPIRIGPILGFGTVHLDIYITLQGTGAMHRNATAKALGLIVLIT